MAFLAHGDGGRDGQGLSRQRPACHHSGWRAGVEEAAKKEPSLSAQELGKIVAQKMPERSILDILCNVDHWLNWSRHYGPLSGSDPKLEDARARYILTTFGYGCNLGPAQTARHMRGAVTAHQLSFVNKRHVSVEKLEAADREVIN